MFEGRKLVIATKHEKEKVIASLFEKELGVQCFVPESFDTDELGTFTGEVERVLDPIANVREKCRQAMELSNCDLGIASEGSFGAHPSLTFARADDEFLILLDRKNNLEILARELSLSTNFDGKQLSSEEELLEFAEKAKFPSHGVILRKSDQEKVDIHKDISDLEELKRVFRELFQKYGSVYAETDMRAMKNPTRMEVIRIAAEKLVEKVKSQCPNCSTPGFGVTEVKSGLPCGMCGFPTRSTLSFVYTCQHCQFSKEEKYPHQKMTEDPMYCDICNP